jgi:hypothetical protein
VLWKPCISIFHLHLSEEGIPWHTQHTVDLDGALALTHPMILIFVYEHHNRIKPQQYSLPCPAAHTSYLPDIIKTWEPQLVWKFVKSTVELHSIWVGWEHGWCIISAILFPHPSFVEKYLVQSSQSLSWVTELLRWKSLSFLPRSWAAKTLSTREIDKPRGQ